MSRYWSPIVSTLTPYVPGEQPRIENLNKLNTNENPYGPSPAVIRAIQDQAKEGLRLYPDPSSDQLRASIAAHHDLLPSQVFVGNGSDEVLALAFLALLKHDAPILFPDISYSFYPVYCRLFEIPSAMVPLREDFTIAVDDYLVAQYRVNGGIIFPNPNAPTGCLLDRNEIERLLHGNQDSVVVIDEAYVDFGGDDDPATIPSGIPLIRNYPNLLVIQTLSKSRSLAGLRVGFAAGHSELIDALQRVKDSFNSYPLDRLAQVGAIAAYEDEAYFAQTRARVMATRRRLSDDLRKLGFEVIPSAANFVFARHPQRDALAIAQALRQRGIIVRHFRQARIDQYLRITIGTDEQCRALTQALIEILA